MPHTTDVTTFNDEQAPPGESPYLPGFGPTVNVAIVPYDPSWPTLYEQLAAIVNGALGERVLALEHVGSTSVPGLRAKAVIDIDLTVADNTDEQAYIPALEQCGFELVIRERWWYEHRLLRHLDPRCNLHVWSPDCPEPARHIIFRDWLREHEEDRDVYVRAKQAAAHRTRISRGDVIDYNDRKRDVIREIYARAFAELGLA
jgi:GrpB-like predicted nucleotidyltransferase (UPF0157 family)